MVTITRSADKLLLQVRGRKTQREGERRSEHGRQGNEAGPVREDKLPSLMVSSPRKPSWSSCVQVSRNFKFKRSPVSSNPRNRMH